MEKIQIRFYNWWIHRIDNLAILKIEADWNITALYFYFGICGLEVAIRILKYRRIK